MATKKKKKPTDINLLAASIVEEATKTTVQTMSSRDENQSPTKNPAAVALGRLGGLKGGPSRAKKLSAKKRKAIAKKAAEARWGKKK